MYYQCKLVRDHSNSLQLSATCYSSLQLTAIHCNSLQHVTHNIQYMHCQCELVRDHCHSLQLTATPCHSLQLTSTHCNPLQHMTHNITNMYRQCMLECHGSTLKQCMSMYVRVLACVPGKYTLSHERITCCSVMQ